MIFHNPSSRNVTRSVPPGGKNQKFLSQNCVEFFLYCLGYPKNFFEV